MGRSNSGDWKMIFGTNLSTLNIGLMMYGKARWQEAEATRKYLNTALIRQDKKFLYLRALQGQSGRNPIDPTLQDNVLIPNNFFEYIYHFGCAVNLHSITDSGLIAGGQNSSKWRQTVFFSTVNPMDIRIIKDPQRAWFDQTTSCICTSKSGEKHQDKVNWIDIQLAQRKGLRFYQTRS